MAVLLLIASACKNDKSDNKTDAAAGQTASPEQLTGHWISRDFISRVSQYGSVIQTINNSHRPYAYGMTFNPSIPDSIMCFDGQKSWNLPVVYDHDTLEMKGANSGKSIFMMFDGKQRERTLTMINSTNGRAEMDVFIKAKGDIQNAEQAFRVAVNHNSLGGRFTPLSKGAQTLTFIPEGKVSGMPGLDRYEICLVGDCFVGGNNFDVVTFSNSREENSNKLMGFTLGNTNDTLTLYNLINPKPGEKVAQTLGAVYGKYLRVKTPEQPAKQPQGAQQSQPQGGKQPGSK